MTKRKQQAQSAYAEAVAYIGKCVKERTIPKYVNPYRRPWADLNSAYRSGYFDTLREALLEDNDYRFQVLFYIESCDWGPTSEEVRKWLGFSNREWQTLYPRMKDLHNQWASAFVGDKATTIEEKAAADLLEKM